MGDEVFVVIAISAIIALTFQYILQPRVREVHAVATVRALANASRSTSPDAEWHSERDTLMATIDYLRNEVERERAEKASRVTTSNRQRRSVSAGVANTFPWLWRARWQIA